MKDNSKGNKQHPMDLVEMQENNLHVDFKEPDNYSASDLELVIDDCQYKIHEGGSLAYATPKLLSQMIDNLKKIRVAQ